LALQFVERDRQVAYALSGGAIDCIGGRSRYADDADLTQSLDAKGLIPPDIIRRC
jgi:hypothetical protein